MVRAQRFRRFWLAYRCLDRRNSSVVKNSGCPGRGQGALSRLWILTRALGPTRAHRGAQGLLAHERLTAHRARHGRGQEVGGDITAAYPYGLRRGTLAGGQHAVAIGGPSPGRPGGCQSALACASWPTTWTYPTHCQHGHLRGPGRTDVSIIRNSQTRPWTAAAPAPGHPEPRRSCRALMNFQQQPGGRPGSTSRLLDTPHQPAITERPERRTSRIAEIIPAPRHNHRAARSAAELRYI
jgi:hypothetical protein